MKKKILALVLLSAMIFSAMPVMAAGNGTDFFPAVNSYKGYSDVKKGAWYEQNAKTCYEVGLMMGSDVGFLPESNMEICEAATIAARMHELLNGGDGVIENNKNAKNWYEGAISYVYKLATTAKDKALLAHLATPSAPATRQDFFSMLSLAVKADTLAPINKITVLPDSSSQTVLQFYNAGILTGETKYGYFRGSNNLTRAEAAAMISRIARTEQRVRFTLAPPEAPSIMVMGIKPETVMLTVGSKAVTANDFLCELAMQLHQVEELAAKQGVEFSWGLSVDNVPIEQYVLQQTLFFSESYAAAELVAEKWGITLSDKDKAEVEKNMAELSKYFEEEGSITEFLATNCATEKEMRTVFEHQNIIAALVNDLARKDNPKMDKYMAAKHILITAQNVAEQTLNSIKKDPTAFDGLMRERSEDGGLEANPEGYLFSEGEMVKEFEAAVKKLKYGEVSGLVKTQFGFHIIQRLDPHTQAFAQKAFADVLTQETEAAGISQTDALKTLDIKLFYKNLTSK